MIYRVLTFILFALPGLAQDYEKTIDTASSWTCTFYKGDPSNTRYYRLQNGFTVIVSPDKSTPRFYACLAIRAGGKDDPANNTGLAHYLEHMLFKGTDKMGTLDYEKESQHLDYIERLYEKYNRLKAEEPRKKIYQMIDSVSLVASNYAIANEYDKLMQQMGVTGTNAFTDFDQTVYINDVPSNQLENWMKVEYERFRNPVLRLFHTELEAVYEEKNISLDADGFKAYEALMAQLFKKHTYGTQTVIGKSDHLKNPSLKEIRKFYQTHYVPGKMALIVAGDLDPLKVVELASQTFGKLVQVNESFAQQESEPENRKPEETTVYGQEAPFVLIGYRLPSVYKTGMAERFYLIEQLLGNEQAGLIQKNLLLPQKLLSASAGIYRLSDYSVLMMEGRPGEGQSLEEVKKLLMAQIDSLKSLIPDSGLIKAIVSNLEIKRMQESEMNESRAFRLLEPFIHGEDPLSYLNEIYRMKQIKPLELNLLARRFFRDNYSLVLKEQGKDTAVQKIEKPTISAVNLNRDKISRFAKDILDNEVKTQNPRFVDFKKEINQTELNGNVPFHYVHNKRNQRFSLEFVYQNGQRNDPALPLAFRYLKLAGSRKYSMEYFDLEFFKIACNISFSVDEFQTTITLNGLSSHFERALAMLLHLIDNPAQNQEILNKLKSTVFSERDDQLSDRNTLRTALSAYALYGRNNPFNSGLSNKQIQKLKLASLVKKCSEINQFSHQVYYYGPHSNQEIKNILNKYHQAPKQFISAREQRKFEPLNPENQEVLYYPYKMLQADIGWIGSGSTFYYDSSAVFSLFNEYFGGGMASQVYQTIREARALAYSCNGYFRIPAHRKTPVFFSAYIGTQADKADSAMQAMQELLVNMPLLREQFETARKSKISQLQNQWIRPSELSDFYRKLQNKGLTQDTRKYELDQLKQLNPEDLEVFYRKRLAGKKFTVYILADPDKLKPDSLKKYGSLRQLQQKELFGY
jgi:predicted Zn-dependent peptidase